MCPMGAEVYELCLKYAVKNALKHGGKARVDAVMRMVLAERPDLRKIAREIVAHARKAVEQVNSMTLEDLSRLAQEKWPELLEREEKKVEEKRELPPLPGAEEGRVVTRFAPNPDFVLHLGSARPAILSYAYARKYKGRFILRFEDTDPKTKPPIPEAYDLIREDLKWLGLRWDEEYIQSLRMEIYYDHARKLIERGGAYVCTHSPDEIKRMRREGVKDPCSDLAVEEHLERWDSMLEGRYGEGEAVLRIKTDYKHPNPAVRDWIAFRVIDTEKYPHPLTGSKYIVWPTYNYACAIDDHLMGVTHILRGKEHETNTIKQAYIYRYMGWEEPVAIHFGRLGLEGTILSKSKIKAGIEQGKYTGWDDPRLGTLIALRKRGILPQAIWDLVMDVGVKPSSAQISMDNLHAYNRKHLEPIANRYMFVHDPVKLSLVAETELKAHIPYHPSYPERGFRELIIGQGEPVYITSNDLRSLKEGAEFRLLGMANFRLVSKEPPTAEFVSLESEYATSKRLPILQWVPVRDYVEAVVIRPVGENIDEVKGVAEPAIRELKEDARVQFFRFGYVRLDRWERGTAVFYYTHD